MENNAFDSLTLVQRQQVNNCMQTSLGLSDALTWIMRQEQAEMPDQADQKSWYALESKTDFQKALEKLLREDPIGHLRRFSISLSRDALDERMNSIFVPFLELLDWERIDLLLVAVAGYSRLCGIPKQQTDTIFLVEPSRPRRVDVNYSTLEAIVTACLPERLMEEWFQSGPNAMSAKRILCQAVRSVIQKKVDLLTEEGAFVLQRDKVTAVCHPDMVIMFGSDQRSIAMNIVDVASWVIPSAHVDPWPRSFPDTYDAFLNEKRSWRGLRRESVMGRFIRELIASGYDQVLVLTADKKEILFTHEQYVDKLQLHGAMGKERRAAS